MVDSKILLYTHIHPNVEQMNRCRWRNQSTVCDQNKKDYGRGSEEAIMPTSFLVEQVGC